MLMQFSRTNQLFVDNTTKDMYVSHMKNSTKKEKKGNIILIKLFLFAQILF